MSGVVGVGGTDGTAGAGGENPADGGAAGIHRRLVVVGTAKYRHEPELPWVAEELGVAVHVFGGLGYHIEERVTDADLVTTQKRLRDWAYRTEGTGTSVVVYWTGHGIGTADRHYLLCADSHRDRLVGTALAAEDLTRIVLASGAERVLLVVDTCDAGQGGTDAAAVAEQLHAALKRGAVDRLAGRPASDGRRLTDFAAIAVARAGEPASSMVFASVLETALARLAVSQKQEYLSVSQVVDTVNHIFEAARIRQRARCAIESESHSFFRFENTGYRPEARYDEGDVAELAARFAAAGDGAEAQRRRADLETHFAPRGQGFEHTAPGRHASYFTGRTEEVDRISAWLAHGDAKWRRGLIVTGGPGVGKSALLGKVLLRSGGLTANAPAPTAIHARHRYLEDLVAAVADAAGITAATPQALLGSLATRRAPLHLIVDALDEAGEAHGDDTEARRIAQDLLRPLLRIPCVRLLVGMRPHVVDAFEGDPAVLDLDHTRESSAQDVADYARRLLQAPDGPASKGPYDDAAAKTVAEEIAARVHGGFLSARIAARYLGRAARAIDTTAPDWRTRVPEVGESPGDTFLRVLRHRLGPDAERGFALLGALALSEGAGLPPDQVWRAVAAACHPEPGTTFAWEDLAWLLDTAGEYLVEDLDADGRSVYRLYHQAYADALRSTFDSGVRQRVADHLATVVPDGPGGPRWGEAPPYLRRHLAEHAEGTTLLDTLALDPEYLLTADMPALQRVLDRATTGPARTTARTVAHCAAVLHSDTDPGVRAAHLRLSAFQSGAGELAAAVRDRYPELPWDTEWADVEPVSYATVGTFPHPVTEAVVVPVHGGPTLVGVGQDGLVRAWDVEGGGFRAEFPAGFGAVDTVRGHRSRPWVALGTAERVLVCDVESGDVLGAVARGDAADWALADLAGACVLAVLDRSDGVTLHHVTSDRAPLVLPGGRVLRGERLAVAERDDGDLLVAVVLGRGRRWPSRLNVWDVSPDDAAESGFAACRVLRRRLRTRGVTALEAYGSVVAVGGPSHRGEDGHTVRTTEANGLRVVEWVGFGAAPVLLLGPPDEPGGDPLCHQATASSVKTWDAQGAWVGSTRTDAPVRLLLAVRQGPDGRASLLVSLGHEALTAKVWPPASSREPDEAPGSRVLSLRTGLADRKPVVITRTATGLRMRDGVSGESLAEEDDPDALWEVSAHPGMPVLRWRVPAAAREDVEAWRPGSRPSSKRGVTVGSPRDWVIGLPGKAHRAAVLRDHGRGGSRFALDGDGASGAGPTHTAFSRRSPAKAVPVGRGVVVAFTGTHAVTSRERFVDSSPDGETHVSDLTLTVTAHDLVVLALPGADIHCEKFLQLDARGDEEEATFDPVPFDLGLWPGGPAVGVLADDTLTVRTWPGGPGGTSGTERAVKRPDTARISAFRLQTRQDRPTVLTATAGGTLTLFTADTTEVLLRIRLGCEVQDIEWVDDTHLAVLTATGPLILRLG
ncbi:hypothetical protein [Streptomyces sp. NBC_00572]|uniref:hypothetical protein n=1 Tax=Streptomyces sp. NBC_00572 TaxID=2903664 RepID=UPI00224C813C|nr:hypothetical protein [Streptomyces sp. NBC_00572]MCX4979904.1 hypothetical protein [Streptomyces sp. NBC_00572]